MKRIDLSGRRFGRLIVLAYSHSHIQPSGQKRAIWDVKCDCGTEKKVSTANLIGKNCISCGCYANERRLSGCHKKEKGEANFNYKYLTYKSRAFRKGIKFDLSKEEFRNVVTMNCHYCGCEGVYHHTKRSVNGLFFSNGIDRIDSSLGYTLKNCLPCCPVCNMMKNNMTYNDFLNHIKRIIIHASNKIKKQISNKQKHSYRSKSGQAS